MYAKQKAVEAQKKKKNVQPTESVVTSPASTHQEASSALPRDLSKVPMTSRRGKPLILARKGSHATGGLKRMHLSLNLRLMSLLAGASCMPVLDAGLRGIVCHYRCCA